MKKNTGRVQSCGVSIPGEDEQDIPVSPPKPASVTPAEPAKGKSILRTPKDKLVAAPAPVAPAPVPVVPRPKPQPAPTTPPSKPKAPARPAWSSVSMSPLDVLRKKKLPGKNRAAPPVHIVIKALAGTGKTTTLIQGMRGVLGMDPCFMATNQGMRSIEPSEQQAAVWEQMRVKKADCPVKTVAFCAFNSSIAQVLKQRVPRGSEAMTMHSLGYRAVRGSVPGVEFDKYRVRKIIAGLYGQHDPREFYRQRAGMIDTVEELVRLVKVNLLPMDCEDDSDRYGVYRLLEDLVQDYNVSINHREQGEIFDLIPKVIEACKDVRGDKTLDYNDMIWLPVVLGMSVFRYDMLLVDEVQDLNRCQQELAYRAGHRLVLCGDENQAIYTFTGADEHSMGHMTDRLRYSPSGVIELPLTVTRRCGHAIVKEAQSIVPSFEAYPSNPAGNIRAERFPVCRLDTMTVSYEDSYLPQVREGDLIECRTNAPLVSQTLRLLRTGRRARMLGRDIGKGLINFVRRLDPNSVDDLRLQVETWHNMEVQQERNRANPSDLRIMSIRDRADCVLAFCEDADRLSVVINRLHNLFSGSVDEDAPASSPDYQRPVVRLCTIHKAKGLEAERVWFLQPPGASCPHPSAKTEGQKKQELNLRYVAITRAIEELVHVV
jgi:DNA helicase-2/ATP-dependent DNA helicase PcrA